MLPSITTFGYAFLGGIVPALVWLHFLLKEDERCPEPRTLITVAFMAGMLAVPVVLPLETLSQTLLPDGTPVLIAWATIEETVKFILAAMFVLWRREVNESIDLVIYMLTVALGFAALENTLFLIQPFGDGQFLVGLATDNLRFVGSTLLHVIASSVIGFSLAFAYKWPRVLRAVAAIVGLILAIALHAVFNFFIISEGGSHTLLAFFIVWTGAIVFFALFEILKYFRYAQPAKNVC
jgi:RsiW-degrading membrane proteinase PrsW (M82 family)